MRMRFSVLLVFASSVLLGACGGGGSNSPVSVAPPPPVSTDIVARGPLESLTPLMVNGTSYATGAASIEVNDVPATIDDLKSGQVVTLRGEASGGASDALEIEYQANVLGPIESVDLQAGIVVVMGQRVQTDARTVLDAALTSASVGDIAEVSGYPDATGSVLATRIDVVADQGQRRLWGPASGSDAANLLFRIGALTVDYSAATLIDTVSGSVADGMEIIVSGTLDSAGVLHADRIAGVECDLADIVGFEGSLTGVVTEHESANVYAVDGVAVRADANTAYIGGEPNELHAGATVRVDGEVDAGGFIRALRVYLTPSASLPGEVVFDITDFTAVKVDGPFVTLVEQGPEFLVEVQVDSDLTELLDVYRDGDSVRIGFRDNVSINASVLRARIVMPVLDGLQLAGATFATVRGFDGPHLDIEIAGAVLLIVNDSHYDTLFAGLTGACALLMEDSEIGSAADVDILAASAATLNLAPGAILDGALLAASALLYYGDGVDESVTRDLTSAVVRLGGSH